MPNQQHIHTFGHAFHQAAIQRLVAEPALAQRALQTLERWWLKCVPSASDPCMRAWEVLLKGDLQALKKRICSNDDHAATLCNTSLLGCVLTPAERQALRAQSIL